MQMPGLWFLNRRDWKGKASIVGEAVWSLNQVGGLYDAVSLAAGWVTKRNMTKRNMISKSFKKENKSVYIRDGLFWLSVIHLTKVKKERQGMNGAKRKKQGNQAVAMGGDLDTLKDDDFYN